MPDTPASWRERLAALPAPSSPPRLVAAGLAAAGVAVALAVAVVAVRGAPPTPEMTLPMAAGAGGPSTTEAAGGAAPATGAGAGTAATYVHVAGAVARPGVYRVRSGGRVTDVVDAAGGPAPDADVDQLNLAAKVADGERVYVPRRGETVPAAGAGAGAPAGPLDLNTATTDQLDALPGVGPATAQAIVDWRTEHGRFTRVQDLLEVRGIGEAKLAALRSRVRV
ncbi:MAG: helix-hairpin-helix domain-containing protein [Actinomycetota bacterium]